LVVLFEGVCFWFCFLLLVVVLVEQFPKARLAGVSCYFPYRAERRGVGRAPINGGASADFDRVGMLTAFAASIII